MSHELLVENGLETGPNKLTNERCERITSLFKTLCDSLRPYIIIMNLYAMNADGRKHFRLLLINKETMSLDEYKSLLSRITNDYSIDAEWDLIHKAWAELYVKNAKIKMIDKEFYENFEISCIITVIDNIKSYLDPNYEYIYAETLDYNTSMATSHIQQYFIKEYIMRGENTLQDGDLKTHIKRFTLLHKLWYKLLDYRAILLPPYPYNSGIYQFIKIYESKIGHIAMFDRVLDTDITRNLVLYFIKLILGKTRLPIAQNRYKIELLKAILDDYQNIKKRITI